MALKYDLYEVNELNNTQGKYRARAVSAGKISTDRLADWITRCSGVSAAEAKGFIEILTDSILDFITDGYEVEVGNLGYFSATVTSKLVDTPHEIRAESIRFNRLNFRAGVQAKRRIRRAGIERIAHSQEKNRNPKSTREERAEKLKAYLTGKPVLTIPPNYEAKSRKVLKSNDFGTFSFYPCDEKKPTFARYALGLRVGLFFQA